MAVVRIPASFVPGEPFARVPVRLNGSGTYQMFFDTGASRTVVTPDVAAQLGLAVRRGAAVVAGSIRVSAGSAMLGSLQLADFEETRIERTVVRVMELPIADGALGLDYLSRFARVCYDFESNELEITTR